jgi:GTP cyclohydrolase I
MPFEGKAHIAYLPDGKVVGLSKLARVVDAYALRPQVQERLTTQLADVIMCELNAQGAAVVFTNVFWPSLNMFEQLKLIRTPLGDFNSFI